MCPNEKASKKVFMCVVCNTHVICNDFVIVLTFSVPVGVGAVNDDAATTAVVSVIISFNTYCVCCYCHGRKIAQ